MSADTKDVSLIKDEDLLRKMWQDTDDFGRKKEIRSHMYKLREQRLREFYNNGENLSAEILPRTIQKVCDIPGHADSLADDSFLSLKSKEIRDSESPTKDSYRISERHNDKGWTISSANERSIDGKRYTSSKIATTSGTDTLDCGKIDYNAKNEHMATVYTDGDERNFTKFVGAHSNSVLRQEAVTGDDKSNMRTSSVETSSSSRIFKESKSYDTGDYNIAKIGPNNPKSSMGTKEVYTTNAPADLITHPAYIEGKTQVIRETKTLPDGTIVRTTRYETKGGRTSKSESTENYTSNINRQHNTNSSSVHTNNSSTKDNTVRSDDNYTANLRNIIEKNVIIDKSGLDDNYHNIESRTHYKTVSSQHTDDREVNNQKVINQQVEHLAKTNIIEDNFDSMSVKSFDSTLTHRNFPISDTSYQYDTNTVDHNRSDTNLNDNIRTNQNISKETHHDTSFITSYSQDNKSDIKDNVNNSKLTESRSEKIPTDNDMTSYRIKKTTAVHNSPKEYTTTKSTYIDNSNLTNHNKIVRNEFIEKERQHEHDAKHNEILSESITNKNIPSRTLVTPQPVTSDQPKNDKKTNEGQYETTYKGNYTNKKISTEVSPTHDAFARSLRSVSPERILSKSPSPSNHSLRRSNSPERKKKSSSSPDRKVRNKTPSKSIDRFSSTETITYNKRLSPEKRKTKSPSRPVTDSVSSESTTTTTRQNFVNTKSTTTTTRQDATKNVNTIEINNTSKAYKETPITKTRSPSPISTVASEIEYMRHVDDIITDLDKEINIITENRPSSLEITTKKNRKVAERSPTSPLTPCKDLIRKESLKSPKDDTSSQRPGKYYPPEERALKRTDTYEERCRQILGLSEINQKRRGSIEKTVTRKNSFRKEVSSPSMDLQRKSPEKKQEINYPRGNRVHEQTNSAKNIIQVRNSALNRDNESQPDRRSPIKDISHKQSPLRKSTEKEQFRSSPQKERTKPQINENPPQNKNSPIKTVFQHLSERKITMKDSSSVKEYPSQIRKSPEKKNITSSSERKIKLDKSSSEINNSPETQVFKPNSEIYEPSKKSSQKNVFPSQIRKSPPKNTSVSQPELNDTVSHKQKIVEITSQTRKSPQRISPEKKNEMNEFPASRRVSSEKDIPVQELQPKHLAPYNGDKNEPNAKLNLKELSSARDTTKEKNPSESIVISSHSKNLNTSEFSTQKERSPEKPPIGYSINQFPPEENYSLREFSSETRKTPVKQISQDSIRSEKVSGTNEASTQITRLSAEKHLPSQIERKLLNIQNIDQQSSGKTPNKILPQKEMPQTSKVQSSLKPSPRRIPESPKGLEEGQEVSSQKKPISKIINTEVNNIISRNNKTEYVSETEDITSSSEDEIDTAEEIITKTSTKFLENRQPVREPEMTKKFISALCSEDTVEKTNLSKKTTENILQEEIENQMIPTENIKEMKLLSSKNERPSINDTFIENERSSNKVTSSRNVSNKSNPTNANNITRNTSTKKITPIPKKSESNKSKIKGKVNLMDIEKENLLTENRTVHIRTHRVDDTFNKKNSQKQLITKDFSPQGNKDGLTKTVPKHNLKSSEVDVKENTKKSTQQVHSNASLKKTTETIRMELKPKKFVTKSQTTPTDKSKIDSKQAITTKTTMNKQIKSKTLIETENNSKPIVKNSSVTSHISSPKVTKTENQFKNHSSTKIVTVVAKNQPTRTKKQMEQTIKKTLSNAIKEKRVDTDVDDSLEGSDIEITGDVKIENRKQTYNNGIHQITRKTETTGKHLKKDISKMDRKNDRRCITTKTIIINNQINENADIIVDLQRSKSSREPTPDRLCPVPLSSDEGISSFPRYPDNIVEPDDNKSHRQPKELSDIPILEAGDSNDRIYEIKSGIEDSNEIEKRPPYKTHTVDDRPIVNDEEDISVLSVSDKVSKFITTAEQLISSQHTDISRSIKTTAKEDINSKVSDKIKQFTTGREKLDNSKNLRPAAKVPRPELEDVDESIKKDECMLSVSDKVSKFITTAEKLTAEVKGQTVPTRIVHKSGTIPISPENDVSGTQKVEKRKNVSPERSGVEEEDLKKLEVVKDTEHIKFHNRRTPDKLPSSVYVKPKIREETTPERRSSNTYLSVKAVTHEARPSKNEEVTDFHHITSNSSRRRTSQEETKTFLGTVGRLRSTESIKKAKELFENIPKEQQVPKQRDILSRPSVFEEKRTQSSQHTIRNIPRKKLSYPEDESGKETVKNTNISKPTHNLKELPSDSSNIPHHMVPLDRGTHSSAHDRDGKTPEKSMEYQPKEPMSGRGKVPHYMTPLESPSPDSEGKTLAKTTFEVHTDRSNVPHYMTLLDRRPHSPSPDDAEKNIKKSNKHKYDEFHIVVDGLPHYMTPLDRKPHSSSPDRETKKSTDTVTENYKESHSDSGKVPHYMLPLDRRPHSPLLDAEHTKITEHTYRENYPDDNTVPHYMIPLDRRPHSPSPDTTYKKIMSHETSSEPVLNQFKEVPSQNNELPHYMTPLDRCHRPHSPTTEQEARKTPEKIIGIPPRSRSPSLERGGVPHYMLPLGRQLKSNSFEDSTHQPDVNENLKLNKFGIILKKTDSKNISSTNKQSTLMDKKKYITTIEKSLTEKEVEEIYDLEILEELLITVVGYDLRKKIRAQIRFLKKLIADNNLEKYIENRKTIMEQDTTEIIQTKKLAGKCHERMKKDEMYNQSEQVDSKEDIQNIEYKPTSNRKTPDRIQDRTQRTEKIERRNSNFSFTRRTSSDYMTTTTVTRRSQTPEKSDLRNIVDKDKNTNEMKSSSRLENKDAIVKLKKDIHITPKSPTGDDKPEWVKQRNLRKTSETNIPTSKKTTVNKVTRTEAKRVSPVKESKPTDLITSSYGVGPTDENGTPLFGLRALRAQNKITKVQGTVITSEYHSENGQEPVGQISVMKYSSDPKDFGKNDDNSKNGITSITTTQKFGYKDTPSLKKLTSSQKKITEDESSHSKSTKVTRRNSVKAISQKFIDNAVETLKSEKQSSYPKAGLILRTSSFKENGQRGIVPSENSPAERDFEHVTIRTTSSIKTDSGSETFLTNKSRVSGVQDVISRMKTEEYREGDTEEDSEARNLLNKFIGSQVILSGMESKTSSSTTCESVAAISPVSTVKRTTKISTMVTAGGKPETKTRVFQRPIAQEVLDTIWEEQTLRLLLEQSTDYEERRLIRARLRQVMAEQEACTELVEKASQEQSSGALDGESLLLPLLQGLLQAPEKEPPSDSGVESGEDQRSNLIAEVQVALDKLAASLRDDGTDISTERRSSLLQLVTKLQDGLATTNPKLERRLSSGPGRFTKKRDRQNRHTIGVSTEELANARRLIEEISINDLTPSQSKFNVTTIQKQNSESSVNSSNNSSFNKFSGRATVKNAVAKPFNSSSNSISNASSTIQTPTEPVEHDTSPFGDDHNIQELLVNSLTKTNNTSSNYTDENKSAELTSPQTINDIESIKSIHQAVQAAARKKVNSESIESEPDEESTTLKGHDDFEGFQLTPTKLQETPIYANILERPDPAKMTYEEKASKFDTQSRKLRMKRANTIDIPKALQYYEDDYSDSESETEAQKKKNTYYALRGPIRVGNPINKGIVPAFELKTKSDQKFLEFLSKNHTENNNQGSLWTQQNKTSVWTNKFGNIKNNFENKNCHNDSAKHFWKTKDDGAASTGSATHYGPKISRRSARNLQQMFEERQRLSEEKMLPNDKHIVTGNITVKTDLNKNYKCISQPIPVNKFSHAPQSAFKPLPRKIEPLEGTTLSQNIFKPIAQSKFAAHKDTIVSESEKSMLKTEMRENEVEKPLFLYSPKPLFNSPTVSTPPVTSKPWTANRVEQNSRVLNIAAKKFEVSKEPEMFPVKPRKLDKDFNKIFNTQPTTTEKRTAPYLTKTTEKQNTVRKMSAEFETLGNKNPEYTSHSTVKYQANPLMTTGVETLQQNDQSSKPFNILKDNRMTKLDQPFPTFKQKQDHQMYPQISHNYQRVNSYNKSACSPLTSTLSPTQNFQPVNYSIRYDQPGVVNNENVESAPASQFVSQHVPGKDNKQSPGEYTSTSSIQFNIKPKPICQQFLKDVPAIHLPKLQTQLPSEGIHEYNAINSKVMTGPISQQAVTIRQKSPMNRNEHEIDAALNLKNSLQRVNKGVDKSPNSTSKYDSQPSSTNKTLQYTTSESQSTVNGRDHDENKLMKSSQRYDNHPIDKVEPITRKKFADHFNSKVIGSQQDTKAYGVVKPMQQKPIVPIPSTPNVIYNNVSIERKPDPHEYLETNEKGQSIVTSKFHIPVVNVAPSSASVMPTHAKILSKSDSWHQICQAANKTPLLSNSSQNRSILKSKSSHSLAVPSKQFEAGMSKEELMQKKKSIEAYFSGSETPQHEEYGKCDTKMVKRSINRLKTSEKLSASRQATGLSRSKTLPDIVCPELLDESNVDQSFEALFKSTS